MPCFVDQNGNYYQDTSAHSSNDQQMVNPSAVLAAVLTSTPISDAAMQVAIQSYVDNAGNGNNGGDFG